jgi:hypothetical protein
MSTLTIEFLKFLRAVKQNNLGDIGAAAAAVSTEYLKDPTPHDKGDEAVRKIIERADSEDAYENLANIIF